MKTNLFKVKEKKERRIIIEEERTKNPFLLFFKRHKNFLLTSGIMLVICLLLISTGLVFSLFRGSNDYDISYIEGDETIDTIPDVDDEDVEDELLGEIARELGIVLQVKTFMSPDGDVISQFTDGTSIIVRSNGKIYRVSTNKDKTFGVDKNGKIDETAKKILVTSTTTTLMDGTIITYYSDGTAKVEHNTQTLFIRDSNNISIENGSSLNILQPSGVAPTRKTVKHGTKVLKSFTDKTGLITIGGEKYIINKNSEIVAEDGNIKYDTHNMFEAISEKTYKDGNTITHFANGSAIITEPNGNVTYVKKSGDLSQKEQKLYEILPNEDESYSRKTFNIANKKNVTYFDNGAAIIINSDGTRQYVEDSDDILYDSKKHITSNPETIKQISEKITTDGLKAFNFENGKSQVIQKNGESYITDTEKLNFKPEDGTEDEPPKEEEDKPTHGGPTINPADGIYISEAENKYNDFKNVENTKFIIKNNNKSKRSLRITIEEVADYAKYNTDRLPPQFVKFQATIGDNYIPATTLTKNTWIDEEGKTNYIIYEGTINAKETNEVALALYVDYEPLTNEYQNKGFIGTIRIYVDDSIQ